MKTLVTKFLKCRLAQTGVLAAIVIAVGALLLPGSNVQSASQAHKLEGSWVAVVPGTPIQWVYTVSPDASGRKAAMSGTVNVRIPTILMYPELFAEQEYITPFIGELVMTGEDTARFTAIWYGMKKTVPSLQYPFTEQVVNIGVTTGEVKMLGLGKSEVTHHLAFYAPTESGLPDGTPFLCLDPTISMDTRMSLVAPCQ